ncbi:MAG: thermonuclease family protein [Humibacillus sp.]
MSARTTRTHAVLGILAALALVGTVAVTGNGTSAAPADTQVISTSRLATAARPSAPHGTSTSAPDRTPAPATAAGETPVARPTPLPAAATWTVTTVVDGDTIWVSRDGISRKIRLIGIDTPEAGQCGFAEARAALQRAIGEQHVTLTGGARDELDRYGRLLRYVDLDGVDLGLRLIQQGYAAGRYDSRDGYGRHTRESSYVQADAASPRAACAAPTGTTTSGGSGIWATTAAPVATPTPVEAPARGPAGPSFSEWPLAGDRHPCPRSAPVKGNESSMIAHSPGQQSYLITNPERCFSSLRQATAAGYRPAKR